MTLPLRFAHPGVLTATPAVDTAPTCHVNPVVRVALFLFVLSIPFEIPHRRGIPLEIPTLTGFIFLATTVLHPSVCYRRIPAAFMWFLAHLWILALVVAMTRVEHVDLVLRHLVTFGQVMLLLWVISNMMADPKVVRGVLLSLVIACTVRAGVQVLGISRTTEALWGGGERVTAFGQNANLSSMILGAGIAAVVGLAAASPRGLPRFGILTWPLAGLMAAATIQSGSRGGILCVAVGCMVLWLTRSTAGHRLRQTLLGLAALIALTVAVVHSPVMRKRFEEATVEGNLAGRERIYPTHLELFHERPLFGWGPIENQYEAARRMNDGRMDSRDAHNMVLELLTSTGAVGAAPFLVGLALCLRAAWRARRGALGVLPLAMLLSVLTGTISGTWISAKILWLALALALGAAMHWATPQAPAASGPRTCAA